MLLLALAALPLQGVAASMATLRCHTDTPGYAPHMMHTQGGHDHDTNRDDGHVHDNDENTSTHAFGHFCFHQFAYTLPVVTLPEAIPGFHVRVFSPHVLYVFFIPERPQRPPLA